MIDTESLTESQWQTAHAIAQTLVKDETDVNELGKAIAYLRAYVNQPDAESRFFKYLKILVSNGRQIGRSDKTPDYYRSIDKACSQYLHEANAHTILHQFSPAFFFGTHHSLLLRSSACFPPLSAKNQPSHSTQARTVLIAIWRSLHWSSFLFRQAFWDACYTAIAVAQYTSSWLPISTNTAFPSSVK